MTHVAGAALPRPGLAVRRAWARHLYDASAGGARGVRRRRTRRSDISISTTVLRRARGGAEAVTANTQPAILTHSIAGLRGRCARGIPESALEASPRSPPATRSASTRPDVAAGALAFSDAVRHRPRARAIHAGGRAGRGRRDGGRPRASLPTFVDGRLPKRPRSRRERSFRRRTSIPRSRPSSPATRRGSRTRRTFAGSAARARSCRFPLSAPFHCALMAARRGTG